MPKRAGSSRESLLPARSQYYLAIISALRDHDPSTIAEMDAAVAARLDLPDEVMAIRHDHRRTAYQYAMAWARTELKWSGFIENPNRGRWSLTQLGRTASDDQLLQLGSSPRRQSRDAVIPELPPPQGPGPHFAIDAGLLTFATEVDDQANDAKRLRALHPVMQETASELLIALHKHEGLWPVLEKAAREYTRLLQQDLSRIDFGRLFGQGLILANALSAAKYSSTTGNTYPLAPDAAALADSLLDMHGPFLMGTEDGRGLVADADRFEASGAEVAAQSADDILLSRAIVRQGPARPEVKEHIGNVLASSADGGPESRKSSYIGGIARNAALVLTAAAVVSGVATLTAIGQSMPVAMAALAAGVFGRDAIKNSKIGQEASRQLTGLVDAATVDFVLQNESVLRRIAKRKNMGWIDKALDWSIAQREDSALTPPVAPPTEIEANEISILIIEPDPSVSEYLKRALTSFGFHVTFVARSRQSALEAASREPPDVVVSEIILSDNRSGIEVAAELRNLYACPTVFVTSRTDNIPDAEEHSSNYVVAKPYEISELQRTIQLAIDEAKANRGPKK